MHSLFHILQRIGYARSKSDAVAKQDGTYVEKKKRKPEESELVTCQLNCYNALHCSTGTKAPAAKKPAKSGKDGATPQQPAPHRNPAPTGREQPNKILFLTSLPEETNDQMLTMLFQQ